MTYPTVVCYTVREEVERCSRWVMGRGKVTFIYLLVSVCKDVFELCTWTTSDLYSFLDSGFAPNFRPNRFYKTKGIKEALWQIKRKRSSLPVDVRGLNTPLLELLSMSPSLRYATFCEFWSDTNLSSIERGH